jgi:hypothetical protein
MANADRSAEQFRKMTETPIPKLILSLAAPTILSMLITSIYNLADTFFVGQISTSASGAVGIVSSLMAILQALGFMLGHGSGSIISRSPVCFHQLLHSAGVRRHHHSGRPAHPARFYDAAGQHRDHPAPCLCLRAVHPAGRSHYDVQSGDEQHPAL